MKLAGKDIFFLDTGGKFNSVTGGGSNYALIIWNDIVGMYKIKKRAILNLAKERKILLYEN